MLLPHVAMLTVLVATAGPLYPQSGTPDETRRTTAVGGIRRSYLLHLPTSQEPGQRMALLLVFHGGGGTASNIAKHTGLTPAATSRGYAVIYPDGLNGHWSDGRAARAGADDVGFVRVLLDSLKRELPVDPRRVFATGFSNGAGMALRLACELPGTFAAIAPVAGGLPVELETRCAAAAPISLLMFQGTRDRLMPYAGGGLSLRRGRILPATATVGLFARANGCAPTPAVAAEPDSVADGTRVRRSSWADCRRGGAVVLYTIDGGGHTWPGGPPVGRSLGRVSRDLHATSVMLDFFDRHPLP